MDSRVGSINEPLFYESRGSIEEDQLDSEKKRNLTNPLSQFTESVIHEFNPSEPSQNSSTIQNQLRNINLCSTDETTAEEENHIRTNWRTKILRFFRQTQHKNIDYEMPEIFFSQVIQDLGSANIGFEQKGMRRYVSGEKNQDQEENSVIPIFNCESPYLIIWEIFVYSFSVIYFFIIPLEIFFPDKVRSHEITQIFQFILLIFLSFNILLVHNTSMYIHGEMIHNRTLIFKKRVRNGQFFIDLICLGIIILDMSIRNTKFPYFVIIFYIKISTLSRFDKKFLNLIQLMRRMKAGYLLIKLTAGIMFLCHIAACIYLKVGYYQLSQVEDPHDEKNSNASWLFPYQDYSFMIQFEWALYWSVTTILTVGYGDITPKKPNEVLVTIISMLISCVIFAYCINKIWEILQDLKKKEVKYLEIMNAINRYMRDKNVNTKLKLKISAYIQYYYKKQKSRDEGLEQVIISKLPPNLREELIYQSHISIFEKVSWMKYFSEEFIKTLAFQIEEYHYPEREPIYCMGEDIDNESSTQGLYFIKEGTIECYIPYSEGKTDDAVFEYQIASENGYGIDTLKQQRKKNLGLPVKSLKKDIYLRHLVKDQYFGETSIFLNEQIPFSVKSVDFSTVYKISRRNFIESIKKFPDDYEKFCVIKEELEFRQKRKQYPKFKCDNCNKNITQQNKEHQILECPHLIPHIKQRQDNFDFVKISNQRQIREKDYHRSSLKKFHSLAKIQLIQISAKQALKYLGNHINNDDMSITHSLSFISQISQGAIIENENESDYDEEDQLSPRKIKRKNQKFMTLTDDISTPKIQSHQQNEIPISSNFFYQDQEEKFNLNQQDMSEQEDGFANNLQQLQRKQMENEERSFVAIVQDEKSNQISNEMIKIPFQQDKQVKDQNQLREQQLKAEEAYNISRSGSQQQQSKETQEYHITQSEEQRNQRNRKRIFSATVKLDPSNLKHTVSLQKYNQQNEQLKLNSLNIQDNSSTTTQPQAIQNILENYFSEFKQIIQSEFSKNKQQSNPSQTLRHASTLPLTYDMQSSLVQQNANNLLSTKQFMEQNQNQENKLAQYNDANENDNSQIMDNQTSIILDIDKMFKFRNYKQNFNYDVVIKRERERMKKLLMASTSRRKTAKSKANLLFKVRKHSHNTIDFGSHIRINNNQ